MLNKYVRAPCFDDSAPTAGDKGFKVKVGRKS